MLITSFCCSTSSLITNEESSLLSLCNASEAEHFFTLEWLIHPETLVLIDLKVFNNLECTGSTGMAEFECHATTGKEFYFLTLLHSSIIHEVGKESSNVPFSLRIRM